MSGTKIAALYGIIPHKLGLCGPKEALKEKILEKFLQGKNNIKLSRIRKTLKEFKGAYPYYELIAKSNKIKDPFDERVVSAYWVGNDLLQKVKIKDLRKMIIKDFSGSELLSKEVALKKAKTISKNSKPHHSFHVLTIGSVTGSISFDNLRLKDICRISWGKIIKIIPSKNKNVIKILVEYQPLAINKKIKLGKPIKKYILGDKNIIEEVKKNDWISFHWNYLVQKLTKKEISDLKKYTLITLNSLK